MTTGFKVVVALVAVGISLAACQQWSSSPPDWTESEIAVLKSLWLESLPDLPPDPSNAVADNPAAAEFGRQLFFDTRLSASFADGFKNILYKLEMKRCERIVDLKRFRVIEIF